MIKKIIRLFKKLTAKLASSTRRFPEAILFAAATVAVLICLNHLDAGYSKEKKELLTRIAMVLALGIPLFLSVKVLYERLPDLKKGVKIAIYVGALAGPVLYYLFLLKDLNMVSITRYIALNISFYFTFAFIPYFISKPNYELYVAKLFTGFFITYLYSLTLYAGLAAILSTIDILFEVNISEKLYFDIFLVVAGVFAPAFFLSDVPEYGRQLHIEDYSKILKGLLLYIVLPLIVAYSSILYVYFGKILISGEWPRGIVANLVLWYSLLSTMVIFFIYPLRGTSQWARIFTAFFPVLILPLLVMMFVALGIRINAYGITENRYFVMVGGLWVTGCMIYFIFARNPRNVLIAVSIAAIAALSVTGPWSCYSVSKLSQNMRFEKILNRNGMLKDGSIVKPSGDIPLEDKRELSAIIRYFDRFHSLKDLRQLPRDFKINQMKRVFGFALNDYGKDVYIDKEYFHHNLEGNVAILDIKDFHYFMELSTPTPGYMRWEEGSISVSLEKSSGQFEIYSDGEKIYRRDIREIAEEIHRANRGKRSLPREQMLFLDQDDKAKVLYVFKHINGRESKSTGEMDIDSLELYVYVFIKVLQ